MPKLSHTRGIPHLLSRRALVRNSAWNLLGLAIPLVAGLVTIPIIINGYGVERFGLLTLAWAMIGYFSLFDLGIGRALTQLVAQRLGSAKVADIPKLVWTGLLLMLGLGLVAALLVIAVTPWLITSALNIPKALQGEARLTFIVLAFALPAVILSAGFTGLLTALQRFDILNLLRVPLGIFMFVAPVLVLPFSQSLAAATAALAGTRILFLGMHVWICLRVMPELRAEMAIDYGQVRSLFSFGGWMTVTNVIAPFMVYMDRFIIAALLSTAAVAFYVTPYEVVTRLWIIVAALVTSLFPAFSTAKEVSRDQVRRLFSLATRMLYLSLTPVVLAIIVFAEEGLQAWLGADFAKNSVGVLIWLAMGVYLNSFAQIPFSLIQGLGRPDLTAKLHLVELPLYTLLLVGLLNWYGIVGAAMAWVARAALDGMALLVVAHRLMKGGGRVLLQAALLMSLPLPLFALGAALSGFAEKLTFFIVALLFLSGSAYWLVGTDERQALVETRKRFLRQ